MALFVISGVFFLVGFFILCYPYKGYSMIPYIVGIVPIIVAAVLLVVELNKVISTQTQERNDEYVKLCKILRGNTVISRDSYVCIKNGNLIDINIPK